MKLVTKRRDGSAVSRKYDAAQTPVQRLLGTEVLTDQQGAHLERLAHALDPVRLLQQMTTLQDALWQHAVFRTPTSPSGTGTSASDIHFVASACLPTEERPDSSTPEEDDPASGPSLLPPVERRHRTYRRTKQQRPRWWRTRADPFLTVWDEVCQWLVAFPERTAKSVLEELQQRYLGQFPDEQLRTLQRRVQAWRAEAILVFDDQWLQEDLVSGRVLPGPLRVGEESDLRAKERVVT